MKKFLSNNKKLIRDYTTILLGSGLGRGLSFMTGIIIARQLGVENFGAFSLFFTLMFLVWQMPNVLDNAYVRYVKVEKKINQEEYLRAVLFLKMVVCLIMSLSSYFIATLLARYFFHKPELIDFLTWAILAGLFLSFLSTWGTLYQAKENFLKYSFINLIFYLSIFLCIGTFAFLQVSFFLKETICLYTGFSIITGLFSFLYLLHRLRFKLFPRYLKVLRQMFHFSKWILGAGICYIAFERLDMMFLGRYTSLKEIGIYSVAIRITMFVSLFNAALGTLFMPKGSVALSSKLQLKNYTEEAVFICTSVLIFIVGLILIAPFMVKTLFTSEYILSVLPVRIILISEMLIVIYQPLAYLVYALNEPKILFYSGIVKLGVILSVGSFLVSKWGIIGAAFLLSLANLAGLGYICIVLKNRLKLERLQVR